MSVQSYIFFNTRKDALEYYYNLIKRSKKKRNRGGKLTSKPSSEKTLRDWFARKGAEGSSSGWVDCNTCRNGKCKPCGRKKGEKRSKYPACRPTPASCEKYKKTKGKSWGKGGKKKRASELEAIFRKISGSLETQEARPKVLILIHPETLLERSKKVFEAYLAEVKENINKFHEVFIYNYLPEGYLKKILDSTDSNELYNEFLSLKSDKIHFKKDKDMLKSKIKDELSSYFIENEGFDIYVSGGYQDMCLRDSCSNLINLLDEEIRSFDHKLFVFEPLVFSRARGADKTPTFGEFSYPAKKDLKDFSPRVDRNAWFESLKNKML